MHTPELSTAVKAYRQAFKSLMYAKRPWLQDDVRGAFARLADEAMMQIVCTYKELHQAQAAHAQIMSYRQGLGQADLELVSASAQLEG